MLCEILGSKVACVKSFQVKKEATMNEINNLKTETITLGGVVSGVR
jgi:hypothetical protein